MTTPLNTGSSHVGYYSLQRLIGWMCVCVIVCVCVRVCVYDVFVVQKSHSLVPQRVPVSRLVRAGSNSVPLSLLPALQNSSAARRYFSVERETDTVVILSAYRFVRQVYVIKGVMFVCLFVCLYLCSVWPAKRLGRSRPNLTHALMSMHPWSVSVKVNVKVIHVCVRE